MRNFAIWVVLSLSLMLLAILVLPPIERAVVDEVVGDADSAAEQVGLPGREIRWWEPWSRPPGPVRVGLQIGHKNQANMPEELARIRANTGASAGGYTEAQVNEMVVLAIKDLLEQEGYVVDVLEAPLPKRYWGDVFLSIHADGSERTSASGYKIASPWMDLTGKSDELAEAIERSYGEHVDMPIDPNITRNMRGYYAFNWRRYEHSIHPMTHAAIVETGFLTNPRDREIITKQTDLVAKGVAIGVVRFVEEYVDTEITETGQLSDNQK